MRFPRVILTASLASVMALIGSCEFFMPPQTVINVTFVNASSENIHLLGPGERMPAGFLAPGTSRTASVRVTEEPQLVSVFIVAIRNRNTKAMSNCYVDEQVEGGFPDLTVTYTEEILPEGSVGSLGCSSD